MFQTPEPLLAINQLKSCSRVYDAKALDNDGKPKGPGLNETTVTIRGRRRVEGRTKELETFEITYLVDLDRLRSLRGIK